MQGREITVDNTLEPYGQVQGKHNQLSGRAIFPGTKFSVTLIAKLMAEAWPLLGAIRANSPVQTCGLAMSWLDRPACRATSLWLQCHHWLVPHALPKSGYGP